MSMETTQYTHPPIPAHLAGLRRFGLGLAQWANQAAARRAARQQAEKERMRSEWELQAEFARFERERERAWITWQLHHLH